MTLEDAAFEWDGRFGPDGAVGHIQFDDAVEQLEIFETHPIDSRAFRSDQLIDARAEILHDEVLLSGGFAVVHFLRPLLERELDAKGLVDGKGDVKEVQAVDSQIIDGVALGGDCCLLYTSPSPRDRS